VVARLRHARDLRLPLPEDIAEALPDQAISVPVEDDQPPRPGLAVDGRVGVTHDGVGAVVAVEVRSHADGAAVHGKGGDGLAAERNGHHKGKAGEQSLNTHD